MAATPLHAGNVYVWHWSGSFVLFVFLFFFSSLLLMATCNTVVIPSLLPKLIVADDTGGHFIFIAHFMALAV